MAHPSTPQFVNPEQLAEALKQVQEAIIQGVCQKMKTPKLQPKAIQGFQYNPLPKYMLPHQHNQNFPPWGESSGMHRGDARRIIKVKQTLGKAHNSVVPSQSVATPYVSKSKGNVWYDGQEESSTPQYLEMGRSSEKAPWLKRTAKRAWIETWIATSTPPLFKQLG